MGRVQDSSGNGLLELTPVASEFQRLICEVKLKKILYSNYQGMFDMSTNVQQV